MIQKLRVQNRWPSWLWATPIVLLLHCPLPGFCQGANGQPGFRTKANLERVPLPGFYAVDITPELSKYVQTDFRDIRIIDEKGQQVPYVFDAPVDKTAADNAWRFDVAQNPGMDFTQKDSTDGNTYISVFNPGKYHITKVELVVVGPKYFHRSASIYSDIGAIGQDAVTSDTPHIFQLNRFNDARWCIRIVNGDNPPLAISGLKTYQEARRIICYLEVNHDYHLELNDPAAHFPNYDLARFSSRIPAAVPSVRLSTFTTITQSAALSSPGIASHKAWIWASILLSILILGFITWKLIQETGKQAS